MYMQVFVYIISWSHKVSDEISLNEVLKVFLSRWKMLVIFALLFILGGITKHKIFPQYPAKGTLLIKNSKNNRYQNVMSSINSSLGAFSASNISSSESELAVTYLDTHQFYKHLGRVFWEKYKTQKSDKEVTESIEFLFGKILLIESEKYRELRMGNLLQGAYSFNAYEDGRIKVSVKTGNKRLSYILINTALEEAKSELIRRELTDLEKAQSYFKDEVLAVKSRLDEIEKNSIRKMYKRKTLSVDIENAESSKYVTEIRQNISEVKIRINENDLLLSKLNNQVKNRKHKSTNSKFSIEARVRELRSENEVLNMKIKSYEDFLKSFGKKQKGLLTFQHEMEKMKANYTFEYKFYENLRGSLASIGLQKTYAKNKVEILEWEIYERVRSRPGLTIIIFMCVMISQVLGFGLIYLWELFKP